LPWDSLPELLLVLRLLPESLLPGDAEAGDLLAEAEDECRKTGLSGETKSVMVFQVLQLPIPSSRHSIYLLTRHEVAEIVMDKLAAHSETSELAGNSERATFLVRLFLPRNTH